MNRIIFFEGPEGAEDRGGDEDGGPARAQRHRRPRLQRRRPAAGDQAQVNNTLLILHRHNLITLSIFWPELGPPCLI